MRAWRDMHPFVAFVIVFVGTLLLSGAIVKGLDLDSNLGVFMWVGLMIGVFWIDHNMAQRESEDRKRRIKYAHSAKQIDRLRLRVEELEREN